MYEELERLRQRNGELMADLAKTTHRLDQLQARIADYRSPIFSLHLAIVNPVIDLIYQRMGKFEYPLAHDLPEREKIASAIVVAGELLAEQFGVLQPSNSVNCPHCRRIWPTRVHLARHYAEMIRYELALRTRARRKREAARA